VSDLFPQGGPQSHSDHLFGASLRRSEPGDDVRQLQHAGSGIPEVPTQREDPPAEDVVKVTLKKLLASDQEVEINPKGEFIRIERMNGKFRDVIEVEFHDDKLTIRKVDGFGTHLEVLPQAANSIEVR